MVQNKIAVYKQDNCNAMNNIVLPLHLPMNGQAIENYSEFGILNSEYSIRNTQFGIRNH